MSTQETFTPRIRKAIRFAVTTHEVDQKQERKGKGTSYISHPMTVGLILAKAGASEDVVAAGILHDTVEDSVSSNKVTYELLIEAFNENVATLVLSVTEENKSLSWEERKAEALLHIASFSHDSVLVKSADILSNCTELIDDFNEVGDEVFTRFNRGKELVIRNYVAVAGALLRCWPESPLAPDLKDIIPSLMRIGGAEVMLRDPKAHIVEYADFDFDADVVCPLCSWTGPSEGHMEYSDVLLDITCPICDKMILIVQYPLINRNP